MREHPSPAARSRLADGVLLGMAKFNRILEIDYDNRCVVAQPGVTNLAITNAVEGAGFYYAPDPSSQIACTIGGNVAENSGGVHCLKYGLTTNNVLGIEMVLIDGEVDPARRQAPRRRGLRSARRHDRIRGAARGRHRGHRAHSAKTDRCPGRADRLSRRPRRPANCVAAVIASGIIPAGMEMMDRPAIHAAEAFVKVGYPLDVEALLIVELDGPPAEVDYLVGKVDAIARDHGATVIRLSHDETERLAFWSGRKAAFPAVGRISPDYYCMDGTIPRARLAEVLARMRALSQQYRLRVANVFHAGDGNLHPLDSLRRQQARRGRARRGFWGRYP